MSPRPRSNAGSATSVDSPIAGPIHAEMALYDALSPRFRRLIDEAPIEQQVLELTLVIRQHGPERAYSLVCDLWERNYPGWRRPEEP
jgi:hypothetical protein